LILAVWASSLISSIYQIMQNIDFRTGQNIFPFAVPPTYRLQEIEDILRKTQALGKNPPSRSCLHDLCEDGTFDAKLTTFGYVVKQSSFWEWMKQFQVQDLAA
jgi:hypothetical protein